ncbi:adrenocortical dysplasia protein homolog isoform X3 [Meriones unguiculatus]|uniref:adrenocortical dysplasia protein homolog isoform X3 n=1 Tax=Meriones unguiculatus TaxID=10047 RepID=UPI000B4E9017|nr:adrenocortical dysplasia protein homolog isoform X3 [Meriones unguiculatus]
MFRRSSMTALRTTFRSLLLPVQGEAVFTVSSLLLHISENEEKILSSIDSNQKVQATPNSLGHIPLEESGASVSLLSALDTSDPGQKNSFQPLPAVCSTPPTREAPNSSPCSSTPSSPLLTCTPSLSPLSHVPRANQVFVTRAQVHNQEIKECQRPIKKRQLFPRTGAKAAQEPCSVWEPPKRHHDASAFQYKYDPPSASLHAQVQTARLSPHLVAWALNLVMESESELTQA